MKFHTTPTLKLTQLPDGALEIVQEYHTKWNGNTPNHQAHRYLALDEQETKALKEFLNDSTKSTQP